MSYILEALKKSEQEREAAAQSLESNIEGGGAQSRNSPLNLKTNSTDTLKIEAQSSILLKIVYASLLIILVLILFKIFDAPKTISDSDLEEPIFRPAVINESVDLEKITPKPDLNDAKTDRADDLGPKKQLIAIEQASIGILAGIPALKITSHIFSSQADRRSIVVNGERMVEGDYVAPNIKILEISSDGMVVSANGRSLIVGRSRGWGQ